MSADDDLRVRLSPGDQAVIDWWYREYMPWSERPEGDRGPVPVCPDGRAINIAARAQTTHCTLRGQAGDD